MPCLAYLIPGMSCHEFGDGFAVHLLSFEVRLMSFGGAFDEFGRGLRTGTSR